ncbi:hypothetical protein D9M72_382990 [compost metagenome]
MPSPLPTSVPLPPPSIVRPVAVSVGLSMSDALARSSAWVISRPPLSSAIAASAAAVAVGVSLLPLTVTTMSLLAVPSADQTVSVSVTTCPALSDCVASRPFSSV